MVKAGLFPGRLVVCGGFWEGYCRLKGKESAEKPPRKGPPNANSIEILEFLLGAATHPDLRSKQLNQKENLLCVI
jgi:hypothetical protein